MRRGLTAIRELKAAQGDFTNTGLRFILKDGESAVIRIYGNFEEEQDPVIGSVHFVKRLPSGSQYHMCANNVLSEYDPSSGLPSPHAGCVFCHEKSKGDKGIGLANRAYFFVKDTRKQHKLDSKIHVLKPGVKLVVGKQYRAEDYVETQYLSCAAPTRPCQYCAQGNQPILNGFRSWELAVSYADQLVSQQAELRNYCRCGARDEEGGPTLSVSQYMCGHCRNPVEFYPDQGKPVVYCHSCRQTLPPLEDVVCAACDTPSRCNLQDFFWKVSRAGSGTDTTYNFEAIHPCRPPTADELTEAEKGKPDFAAIMSPDPAEQQAAVLAVACPFQTPGHGAVSYDKPAQAPLPVQRMAINPVRPSPSAATSGSVQQSLKLNNGKQPAAALTPAPKKLGFKFPIKKSDDIIY